MCRDRPRVFADGCRWRDEQSQAPAAAGRARSPGWRRCPCRHRAIAWGDAQGAAWRGPHSRTRGGRDPAALRAEAQHGAARGRHAGPHAPCPRSRCPTLPHVTIAKPRGPFSSHLAPELTKRRPEKSGLRGLLRATRASVRRVWPTRLHTEHTSGTRVAERQVPASAEAEWPSPQPEEAQRRSVTRLHVWAGLVFLSHDGSVPWREPHATLTAARTDRDGTSVHTGRGAGAEPGPCAWLSPGPALPPGRP